MPFPRNLLNEGEVVHADTHPHLAYFTQPGVITLVGILLGIAALVRTDSGSNARKVVGGAALVLLVVGLAWLASRFAKWRTTNMVVTSDRLIFRSGLLAKSGIEIPIDRVMNVNSSQTVWERVIGSGDLVIESGGEDGAQKFSNIRKPAQLQKLIIAQTRADEKAVTAAVSGMNDPASQLEKLAGLLEKGHITQEEFDAQKAKLLS